MTMTQPPHGMFSIPGEPVPVYVPPPGTDPENVAQLDPRPFVHSQSPWAKERCWKRGCKEPVTFMLTKGTLKVRQDYEDFEPLPDGVIAYAGRAAAATQVPEQSKLYACSLHRHELEMS